MLHTAVVLSYGVLDNWVLVVPQAIVKDPEYPLKDDKLVIEVVRKGSSVALHSEHTDASSTCGQSGHPPHVVVEEVLCSRWITGASTASARPAGFMDCLSFVPFSRRGTPELLRPKPSCTQRLPLGLHKLAALAFVFGE